MKLTKIDNVARYELENLWDRSYLDDPFYRGKVDLIRGLVPDDVSSVLDVGCGNGTIASELAGKRFIVAGDRSRTALRYVEARAVQLSADSLPFGSRSFDLVMSHQVLEHLPEQVFARAGAELARVARRYVMISVPYRDRLNQNRACCRQCGFKYNIWGHVRAFKDVADVRRLFPSLALTQYALCGQENEYSSRLSLFFVQELGGDWSVDPTAVCPRCGSRAQYRAGFPRSAFASLGYRLGALMPKEKSFWWLVCLFEQRSERGRSSALVAASTSGRSRKRSRAGTLVASTYARGVS